VNVLEQGETKRRLIFRWITLKGLMAILLFTMLTASLEYLICMYAIDLGVEDVTLIELPFQFPAATWTFNMAISPLFHLVPIAVIISLASSWTYLTKRIAVEATDKWKGRIRSDFAPRARPEKKRVERLSIRIEKSLRGAVSSLKKIRGVAYLWRRIHFARATIKSALMVLLLFSLSVLVFSVLMYPQLIYWTVSDLYQHSPSLLDFVNSANNLGRTIADSFDPIRWLGSAMNNNLLSVAPGFRDLALGVGGLTGPLVLLDNASKYLVLQNVAAWVSASTALILSRSGLRSSQYRKRKR